MDAHNLGDGPGEINKIEARILKTVKGIGFHKSKLVQRPSVEPSRKR